jgi:predicted AlkP superfamily phosphohydrolase/phosphomutase
VNAPDGPLRPVLVLALDGASFDVIEPLIKEGRLPHLSAWMKEGHAQKLPSTTPPVTFPAWSSFMTGLAPAQHGIFDFSQKLPGQYQIRFVNASDRQGRSIQSAVSQAGGQALVLGLPATFPPEKMEGLLVPGFDAPVSTGTDAEATSHPELYRRIAAEAGHWMRPDMDESATGASFHETAMDTLLTRIDRKTEFVLTALKEMRDHYKKPNPDLTVVVFSESDTAGHHYWRDHDPGSPRHDPDVSEPRQNALGNIYEKLDEACGRIRNEVGQDALCVVLSDHGMGGASEYVVHLNAFLAQNGFLARKRSAAGLERKLARFARDMAIRLLPASVAQMIFRRARGAAGRVESAVRFGGLNWSETQAFSEEVNTQPGIWINLQDREKEGCVSKSDYESVRESLITRLMEWTLPNGESVVASARRREEVHPGPFMERAPDIVIELALDRGYGLSLVPTNWQENVPAEKTPSVRLLEGTDLAGGRGRGMNGTHRNDGIFIATGEGESLTQARAMKPESLVEVAGELSRAMGLPWQPEPSIAALPPRSYTEEEDAAVAARLRDLGYLD